MNRIYKTIWSKTRSMYIVVSELAKGHTKSPSSARTGTAAVLAAFLLLSSIGTGPAYAENPSVLSYVAVQSDAAGEFGNAAAGEQGAAAVGAVSKEAKHNVIHYLSIGLDNEAGLGQGGNYNNDGADSHWGIAIGVDASSKEAGIAMGKDSRAWGNQSISFGSRSHGIGDYTTAVGHEASAFNESATAVGSLARAYGIGATALGGSAVVAVKPGIDKADYDKLSDDEKKLYNQTAWQNQKKFFQIKEIKEGKVKEIKTRA